MDYSFVSFLCIISLVKTEESKRLLLNDPDVIGSRLSNIEKSMQEMTRATTQLQAEFGQEKAQMQTTISQLQMALSQVIKGTHYKYTFKHIYSMSWQVK